MKHDSSSRNINCSKLGSELDTNHLKLFSTNIYSSPGETTVQRWLPLFEM